MGVSSVKYTMFSDLIIHSKVYDICCECMFHIINRYQRYISKIMKIMKIDVCNIHARFVISNNSNIVT